MGEEMSIAKALNDMARHEVIKNLYLQILFDIAVCDIEGWDKTEFIRMIQDAVNRWKKTSEE